jgi:hypothetical protein
MSLSNRLWPARVFRLPPFELAPLEFEPELESAEDELLLDEPVTVVGPVPAAVPYIRLVPTAGELHDRIEQHLRTNQGSAPRVDAADELRAALADLRRSLR